MRQREVQAEENSLNQSFFPKATTAPAVLAGGTSQAAVYDRMRKRQLATGPGSIFSFFIEISFPYDSKRFQRG